MNLYPLADWSKEAACILHSAVEQVLLHQGACSILLTGGRSGALLYRAWSSNHPLKRLKNVSFYFGDERCVPTSDIDSNYHLVMCNLFANGIPSGCYLHRFNTDFLDIESEITRYSALLPAKFDIALFGIGDDGHIASLFPHSPAINEVRRRVVAITAPTKPNSRITVTPSVVLAARIVFALAPGPKKAAVFKKLQNENWHGANYELPARLLKNANWLIEKKYIKPL